MPVYGRMPVVASEESWCELARRGDVGVTIQGVADLVGILLVNTGQRKVREAFGSVDVESRFGSIALSESGGTCYKTCRRG